NKFRRMIPSRIGTKGITLPLENQQNYWVLTLVMSEFGVFGPKADWPVSAVRFQRAVVGKMAKNT
uniref:hypothetical protein n=1 Tax=Acidocella facilis TaxID=525 RepID=UPI001B80C184